MWDRITTPQNLSLALGRTPTPPGRPHFSPSQVCPFGPGRALSHPHFGRRKKASYPIKCGVFRPGCPALRPGGGGLVGAARRILLRRPRRCTRNGFGDTPTHSLCNSLDRRLVRSLQLERRLELYFREKKGEKEKDPGRPRPTDRTDSSLAPLPLRALDSLLSAPFLPAFKVSLLPLLLLVFLLSSWAHLVHISRLFRTLPGGSHQSNPAAEFYDSLVCDLNFPLRRSRIPSITLLTKGLNVVSTTYICKKRTLFKCIWRAIWFILFLSVV